MDGRGERRSQAIRHGGGGGATGPDTEAGRVCATGYRRGNEEEGTPDHLLRGDEDWVSSSDAS